MIALPKLYYLLIADWLTKEERKHEQTIIYFTQIKFNSTNKYLST